jgi:hypothetical protein
MLYVCNRNLEVNKELYGLIEEKSFGHILYKEMVNPNFEQLPIGYRGFELNIEGSEIIRNLPYTNVLYRIIRPTLLMLWRCSMCLTPA